MNDEKYEARKIKLENKSKLAQKADNYWFHYKWHTIIVAAVLVIALFITLQTCGSSKADIYVVYAGRNLLSSREAEDIKNILSTQLASDINKDGDKIAVITNYRILSGSQIKDIEAVTDVEGNRVEMVNRSYNANNLSTYNTYLQTGEVSLCLLDEWLFETLLSTGRLADISGYEGFVSDKSLGVYGMRLGDTEIYKYYSAFAVIPADTVICLHVPILTGKSGNPEKYAYETEFFTTLLGFKNPG